MKLRILCSMCVTVFACPIATAVAQDAGSGDVVVAVTNAVGTPGTDGRPLLPPGTTADRFEWVGILAHIDLTLPENTDPSILSPANVESVYRVFADAIDPSRATGGLAIRGRIGSDAEYVPLEALGPQPLPVPQSDDYVVEKGAQAAVAQTSVEKDGAQASAIGGPVSIAGTQPTGALSGVIIYCAAGHGWTAGASSWYLQRGLLLDMVEDYGNIDQLNYFVQYAFNAGATVVPFRPVGYRTVEVVLDNDDPGVTYTGAWTDSTATSEYYENQVTVSGVPYRWATAAATQSATARYTPNIPSTGFWPVYCWTRDGTDRVRQTYRIAHSGGVSSVVVDHRMVGKGWIWLGEYHLLAGTSNYVEITNASADSGVVIADAIRFGNGMGNVVGAGPGTVSGYPREEECSRYWAESEAGLNAVGMSSSIWNCCSDDSSDNVGTAARWAAAMNRETYTDDRWRTAYIEFHSNAAGCSSGPPCSAKGTICLVTNTGATTNQTQFATIVGDKVEADLMLIDDQFEYLWGARSNPYTGAYGAISTPNNGNEFDATLIEVAFHDNVEDAANLLNPKVRNAVARSTLQGIVKFLNGLSGSTVPLVYLPESPENVRAVQDGSGGVAVSWTTPPSGGANGSPATGYKIYRSTNGYGFDNGTAVGNVLSSTLTDVPPNTTTYLRVAATNAGGESMPSETLAVRVSGSGASKVLLVNGFDRVQRTQDPTHTIPAGTFKRPILRRMNSFDYVVQHAEAVAAAGYGFDAACNEVVASGAVPLSGYAAVIWACGEESLSDKTFSAAEQSVVTAYLNGGGALFASGSEIAWELDNQGMGQTFYENMLRADYLSDSAGTYQVTGASGGIFSDVGAFNFDPASGAPYNVTTADAIAPKTGARTALTYVGGTGNGAAVQYDSGVYRVVTLGFPFECITSPATRNAIMARALAFLMPQPPETCALVTIGDFEGYADGTTSVVFRSPRFSGTSGHLAASPDVCQVTSEVPAYDGTQSCKVQWAFLDATPQRWLRLTTYQATNVSNPTIWLDQPLRVRVRLDSGSLRMSLGIRETNTGALIGADGGTAGTIEWVGASGVVSGAPQGVLISAAPGVWQTITFKPYVGPIAAFTGDGVLTGTHSKGVLEHLAFSVVDAAGPFTLYVDGIEQLCRGVPADVDYDGDVDLIDFGAFQGCFNGPNRPFTALDCVEFDFDSDADVDLSDFAVFQMCFAGPNRPSPCS